MHAVDLMASADTLQLSAGQAARVIVMPRLNVDSTERQGSRVVPWMFAVHNSGEFDGMSGTGAGKRKG